MTTESPVGKIGRVTGRIGPDTVGEVIVEIRGGTEAFLAHPADSSEEIPTGTRVLVLSVAPPRTIYVTTFDGF